MVDFAPGILLLHYGTNDLKKELTPQKIAPNILMLAEECLKEVREMSWFLELLIEVMIINYKVQKVNEFLSEIRARKTVKYLNNGNIGLGMLNRSKLHLNKFGTIQLVKNYRGNLKT